MGFLKPIDEIHTSSKDVEVENSADSMESLSRYADLLETHFPRAVPDEVLINHATKVLGNHGFNPETSINLVSTCRDEICRPFTEQLDRVWGNSFNISSLAGFCFCGRTGFKAAMAHAPIVDGMERYVFWVAPHIGLTLEGEVGKVYRPGREAPSSACGAMIAVHNELKSGRLNISLDPLDVEQSLLKQQLVNGLHYGHVPTLVDLTYQAYETIFTEVQRLAAASTDPMKCEYVIIAGVQVHGPCGQNFFWPGKMVKVAAGGVESDLYEEYAASVASLNPGTKKPSSAELQAWCLNTALANLQLQRRRARLAAVMGNVAELKRTGINLPAVTDNQRRSLLHIAAMNGQVEVAKLLLSLDEGLLEAQDISHMTPIDYAVQENHDAVADLLAARGAGLAGDRLREQLVAAVAALDVAAVARLYRYAKDGKAAVAEAADKDGRSLMHICLASAAHDEAAGGEAHGAAHKAMIEELFKCGADWGAEMDFFGNNVLSEAMRSHEVGSVAAGKLAEPSFVALKRNVTSARSLQELTAADQLAHHPSPAAAGRAQTADQPVWGGS